MAEPVRLTAVITREGSVYSSLCPELDIASVGDTEAEALAALQEAVELYLEEVPDALAQMRSRTVTELEIRGAA